MIHINLLSSLYIMVHYFAMTGLLTSIRRSGGIRSVTALVPFSLPSKRISDRTRSPSINQKFVLFSTSSSSTTPSTTTQPTILPRIKTCDANEPSDGPIMVKGWVRTVRKQKTLAFVEVNDGSNLGGIQCVLSFDDIDELTREGTAFLFSIVST